MLMGNCGHNLPGHESGGKQGPRARSAGDDSPSARDDYTRLTYRYSGRDYRLTDVGGKVVREIMA